MIARVTHWITYHFTFEDMINQHVKFSVMDDGLVFERDASNKIEEDLIRVIEQAFTAGFNHHAMIKAGKVRL